MPRIASRDLLTRRLCPGRPQQQQDSCHWCKVGTYVTGVSSLSSRPPALGPRSWQLLPRHPGSALGTRWPLLGPRSSRGDPKNSEKYPNFGAGFDCLALSEQGIAARYGALPQSSAFRNCARIPCSFGARRPYHIKPRYGNFRVQLNPPGHAPLHEDGHSCRVRGHRGSSRLSSKGPEHESTPLRTTLPLRNP